MENKRGFHSLQSFRESLLSLVYLPFHLVLIPLIIAFAFRDSLDDGMLNFVCYAIGAVFMVVTQWSFLRDDFARFCDRPGRNLIEIAISYGLMIGFNLLVSTILVLLDSTSNPNNEAVVELAVQSTGPAAATVIFLAPIVEECMFRAGIFGLIRRYSRIGAYIATALIFAAYHVWGYALTDPRNWIYLIQYIPVTVLLCRCYERTDSIWGSIFFHMTINAVSLKALMFLEELL